MIQLLIIARITKMWHRDVKWANVIGKMTLVDSFDAGWPQTFNFLKTALSVKHNKTRYACDLHFVDEKVEAQRGDDLPKVTQLVSDRLRVRLWDSCHLIPGLLAGVVPLWCSGRKRERAVRTPFLCQSSCISWWWCCFSPWSVLSGRTPREQIGKLMSLFLTLRTVHLPQTLSQISLHKASQQQSPTLGPAKKQPPCPELGVTNPSLL